MRHAPVDRADRRRRRARVAALCLFGGAFLALGFSGGGTHPLTAPSVREAATGGDAGGTPSATGPAAPHDGVELHVTPGRAGTGDLVAVTGASFEPGSTVYFGDVQAETESVTRTSIAAVVPPDLDAVVDVVVRDPDGATTGVMNDFDFTDPTPSVGGVVPPTGPKAGGQVVQITGSNLYQYTLKQPDLSIKTLQEAMSNLPDNQDLGVLLGIAFEQTGDTASAKQAFQSVLDQNPQNPAATAGMARVGS